MTILHSLSKDEASEVALPALRKCLDIVRQRSPLWFVENMVAHCLTFAHKLASSDLRLALEELLTTLFDVVKATPDHQMNPLQLQCLMILGDTQHESVALRSMNKMVQIAKATPLLFTQVGQLRWWLHDFCSRNVRLEYMRVLVKLSNHRPNICRLTEMPGTAAPAYLMTLFRDLYRESQALPLLAQYLENVSEGRIKAVATRVRVACLFFC